ncbi:MAG: hypothetical protein V3T05_06495 [Myxococcota bacterium]
MSAGEWPGTSRVARLFELIRIAPNRRRAARASSVLIALTLPITSLVPGTARAGGNVVIQVENSSSGKAQAAIEKLVPGGVGIVSVSTFQAALRKLGLPALLADKINDAGSRGDLIAKVQAAGIEVGASMVILGRVLRGKAIWLLAIDVASGNVVIDREVPIPYKKGRKRKRKRVGGGPDLGPMRRAITPFLESAATVGAVASGDTGGDTGDGDWGAGDWGSPYGSADGSSRSKSQVLLDDDKKADDDDSSTSTSRRRSRRGPRDATTAFLVVAPGYVMSTRNFVYHKPETQNLRPYKVGFTAKSPFASVIGLRGELYPVALTEIPYASDIGIVAGYWKAVGLKSSPEDGGGGNLGTTWDEIEIGAKYRVRLGTTMIGARISYGRQRFVFSLPEGSPLIDEVPAVDYKFVRAGLDGRLDIAAIAVLFGGGYRQLLSTGAVGDDYFPKSSTISFDVFIGGGYRVMPMLETRAIVNYSRFNYTLNAEANASYRATGATDQYLGLELGVVLFL